MFFNKESTNIETGVDRIKAEFNNMMDDELDDLESTYFSCIKIISESIAKTSIDIKRKTEKGYEITSDNPWHECLTLRANPYMSIVDCLEALVAITKHEGIGALFIDRYNKHLYPVRVTSVIIDNLGLIKSDKKNKVLYTICDSSNNLFDCFEDELIILRDNSINGIEGRATRNTCRVSLNTAIRANRYLNDLFANGLTNKLVVQLASDIQNEEALIEIQDKFNRMFTNKGRVFTVPAMYKVAPLNLSLADSQFAELKKLGKQEIAIAMGVPLSKLGIKQETAKSNEQDNLDFLTDTLQIIFTKLEKEMNYKIFIKENREKFKIVFNVGSMLRLDAKTQAEVITTYTKNGIYTLNYAKGLMGVPLLDEDVTVFPSGQVTLDQLVKGEVSYMKGGEKDE